MGCGCGKSRDPSVPALYGWRIWYEHGKVFNSDGICPKDLPDDYCLGVRLYFTTTKPDGTPQGRIIQGESWYFFAEGPRGLIVGGEPEVRGRNKLEEIRRRYPGAKIIQGALTDEVTMALTEKLIMEATTL